MCFIITHSCGKKSVPKFEEKKKKKRTTELWGGIYERILNKGIAPQAQELPESKIVRGLKSVQEE